MNKEFSNLPLRLKIQVLLCTGLGAGLAVLMIYFYTFLPLSNYIKARNWVATTCYVSAASVDKTCLAGWRACTYRARIDYVYEYDGMTYRGNRYNFIPFTSPQTPGIFTPIYGSFPSYKAKKFIQYFPRGTELFCYVNPENPAQSVIQRDMDDAYWWLLFPFFVVLAPTAIYRWYLFLHQ